MQGADLQLASQLKYPRTTNRSGSSTNTHANTFALDAAALEAAGDAMFALDGEARVTAWNRAAEVLYELDAAAVIGRRFAELVSCSARRSAGGGGGADADPGDVSRFAATNGAALSDGPATHVTGAGRAIPVRVSMLESSGGDDDGHDDEGGGGSRWRRVAIVRDESAQVGLAESLAERLKFETLVSELSARFAGLTEEQIGGEIELWLRRLVEMLGVERGSLAEIMPDGKVSVTHAYAVPGVAPYPREMVENAFPWLTAEFARWRTVALSRIPEDLPEQASDAERRYFADAGMKSGIGIPIFIGGALMCVLTFSAFRRYRDWPREVISHLSLAGEVFANALGRRQAKERLAQKQSELAHVGRVAAMGELASVIAHELDQPLTAVVSNAQAVRYMLQSARPDLVEADEALKDVVDSAMRVSEIVQRERQLLRKSRPSFEPVDLNEAVREVELFIRAEARQAGARLVLELVPGLPLVDGDRVQLEQVILNLARNAVQAMKDQPSESKELCIRTASGSSEVTLSVCDAGPPADEAMFERMFEAFYTTKADGLGMGLSISKSIVNAHQGRIWASRNSDRGVTMHLALPRK